MSFSVSILENIKQMDETDEEELPNSTEILEVLQQSPEEENNKEDATNCVDPLFENVEMLSESGFQGEYKEEEFVSEYSDEDELPLRQKRGRLQSEFIAPNGFIWNTSRDLDLIFESAVPHLQATGKGPASTASNALEVWHLLIDEQILTQIVQFTNEEIKQRRSKSLYQRSTDITELRAWLGLNYLCGIFRNSTNNGPLDELWSLELGNAIFRATMTVKRFEFLAECIRFSATAKNKKSDFSETIEIWQRFLINCRSYYAPGGNCVADVLTLNILDTHSTEMFTLCDSKTLYMCNATITGSKEYMERELLRLVADIRGTNRNIVLTERHTSIELAKKFQDAQLTLVGALQTGGNEIPRELLNSKASRKFYTSHLSLITNQGSTGLLLSSGLPSKVNAAKLYSFSVGACQRYQQIAQTYSTKHATSNSAIQERSGLQFFHCILDFAAVNAWVLLRLSEKGDSQIQQRDFQRHLGLYLTQQQLKRQLHASNRLSLPQKIQISEVLGEPTNNLLSSAHKEATKEVATATIPKENLHVPEGVLLLSKTMEKRGRCRLCPRKNSIKTRFRCQQCLMPLCQKHYIQRCRSCSGVLEPEPTELSKEETVREDNDSSS